MVERFDHELLDLGLVGAGGVPVIQDPADPFEPAAAVGLHSGRVGQRRPQLVQDSQARLAPAPPDDFGADLVFEPVLAQASGTAEVTVIAEHQHPHRGDPGDRLERLLRRGEGGWPHAFEQVADLLDAAGVRVQQLGAAGTQVTQPASGLIDRLRQVATQTRHQPRDQDRVLVVGLVVGQILGLARP